MRKFFQKALDIMDNYDIIQIYQMNNKRSVERHKNTKFIIFWSKGYRSGSFVKEGVA
ncbi:MAG: hypothetical protein Q4A75_07040 [Peptostreptococcaceae bacterium]|nr:hypothetical protein [Peptostreptococcaceae bacterium]